MLELLLKRHIPEYRERMKVNAPGRGGVVFIAPAVESADECVAKVPDVIDEASPAAAERGTGNGSDAAP